MALSQSLEVFIPILPEPTRKKARKWTHGAEDLVCSCASLDSRGGRDGRVALSSVLWYCRWCHREGRLHDPRGSTAYFSGWSRHDSGIWAVEDRISIQRQAAVLERAAQMMSDLAQARTQTEQAVEREGSDPTVVQSPLESRSGGNELSCRNFPQLSPCRTEEDLGCKGNGGFMSAIGLL